MFGSAPTTGSCWPTMRPAGSWISWVRSGARTAAAQIRTGHRANGFFAEVAADGASSLPTSTAPNSAADFGEDRSEPPRSERSSWGSSSLVRAGGRRTRPRDRALSSGPTNGSSLWVGASRSCRCLQARITGSTMTRARSCAPGRASSPMAMTRPASTPHVRPLIQQSWHRCASELDRCQPRRGAARQRTRRRSSSSATPAASCATRPANSFGRVGRLLEGAPGDADPDRPRGGDRRDHGRPPDIGGRTADPSRGRWGLEREGGRHKRHRHGALDRRAGVRARGRAFLRRHQAVELCRACRCAIPSTGASSAWSTCRA